jgi:inner centromere protein
LKSGTPSKIALFSKTTTPLSVGKIQKSMFGTSTAPLASSSSASGSKTSKPMKKVTSMSHESLEDPKKPTTSSAANALIEEKRKMREEKMKQAQLQREALEKEKREQAIKAQFEREEKYRKIMKDKEDKQRMEAMKKKILKEKQAKKFAEEKARKEELSVTRPIGELNESLRLKLGKQKMADAITKQKKEESKSTYNFDMLHTDDETDDESRPVNSRPPAPEWSQRELFS